MDARDLRELSALLGEDAVSWGSSELDLHARDESHHPPARPEAVAWPESTEQVSALLRFANGRGIPVTPWAGGTSLEGNPLPVRGGIVLDVTRMDRILRIRPEDLQADVQAGVAHTELNRRLAGHGLFFPPDPGAPALVGGMIGNNASGVRAVAYGATRDSVLALEAVLADGQVILLGSRAVKSSSGYDLLRLLVGSEGTLAVVTGATLRLQGLPPAYLSAVATFEGVGRACAAVGDIVRFGLRPAALELMDRALVEEINRDRGTELRAEPTLFLEFHGPAHEALQVQLGLLRQILDEHGATSLRSGLGPDERAQLWEVRHGALDSIKRNHKGLAVLIADTCVPISRFAELVRYARRAVEREGALGRIFGHAGDGNLHLALLFDPAVPESQAQAQRVNARVAARGLELGGTCTGEHGIGLGKLEFAAQEHGAALEVMRRIKRALDPKGILNPGKMLPE